MSQLTPAVENTLKQGGAIITLLLKVALPGHTIRILPGAGAIAWGGETYSGIDPTFGVLADIDVIEDGAGDDAPAFRFSMNPPGDAAAADLASAAYQGAPMWAWFAAVHPSSGLLIPDPMLLFAGRVDIVTLRGGRGKRSVDFECISDFELLLEDDEGARLSDAFHQSIWPGETGFANTTGIERTIYWGTADPNQGAVNTGLSGGIGEIANRYSRPA